MRDLETKRFRAMTADQKVAIASALWRQAREAMVAGVRATHPDWPDDEVFARVRELFRDAGP